MKEGKGRYKWADNTEFEGYWLHDIKQGDAIT